MLSHGAVLERSSAFELVPSAGTPDNRAVETTEKANEEKMPDNPREIVLQFYEAALNEKNTEKAKSFLGDTYIQHNPHVPDGIEGFLRFVQFRRDKFPGARNEVKRVIAEGDLVMLHVHSVVIPGSPGRQIVDIFRVENGKVVEHWDVIQEIPVAIFPPINDNGLF
jgi:predicted SnoaL-like aldol condensation-catalyzing enzyme